MARPFRPQWPRRLLWFALLWCAGVAAVTLAGYALRALMPG